jgi:hypothetical protein
MASSNNDYVFLDSKSLYGIQEESEENGFMNWAKQGMVDPSLIVFSYS